MFDSIDVTAFDRSDDSGASGRPCVAVDEECLLVCAGVFEVFGARDGGIAGFGSDDCGGGRGELLMDCFGGGAKVNKVDDLSEVCGDRYQEITMK